MQVPMFLNRQVFVNGQPVEEPFVHHSYPDQFRPGDDFPPPNEEYLGGATTRWTLDIQNYIRDGELIVPPGQVSAIACRSDPAPLSLAFATVIVELQRMTVTV